MARFTKGWIKMWRVLLEPDSLNKFDGYSFSIFGYLIMMANWQDGETIHRKTSIITVKRGQVLTSDKEISEITQFSRKIVRSRLKLLHHFGRIVVNRDNHGTIITICNYDRYQSIEYNSGLSDYLTDGESKDTPEVTSKMISKCKAKYTRIEEGIKNLKNYKEEEEEGSPSSPSSSLKFICLKAYEEGCKKSLGYIPISNIEEMKDAIETLISDFGVMSPRLCYHYSRMEKRAYKARHYPWRFLVEDRFANFNHLQQVDLDKSQKEMNPY
jgi:hypothetical protein